jgi:hypothetical protein
VRSAINPEQIVVFGIPSETCAVPSVTKMRCFHVVGVTEDLTHTLVIRTTAGWLLPWLNDNPQEELPLQTEAMLRRMVSTSVLVHEAPLPLGPTLDHVVHGYCCALVRGPLYGTDIAAVAHTELSVTRAIIPLQRQAWEFALGRLRAPVADFDSGPRVAAALEWAERQIIGHARARVLSMTRHRCSRHEYVMCVDTTQGMMYFKGGLERVADEGVLTGLLSALDAQAVPATLAIDVTQGRWVYLELRGDLLIGPQLTVKSAALAAAALAALQKRTLAAPTVRDHLRARRLTAIDLFDAIDLIVHDVADCHNAAVDQDTAGRPDVDLEGLEGALDTWRANRGAILERCSAVDRLNLPLVFVPSDFWPRNVVVTADGIGFIDVERSYWSLPILSLWRFTHEVERILQTDGIARGRIESAFSTGWADIITLTDMTRALAELPLLGGLFSVLLLSRDLDQQERDLGSQMPAPHRAIVLLGQLRQALKGSGF